MTTTTIDYATHRRFAISLGNRQIDLVSNAGNIEYRLREYGSSHHHTKIDADKGDDRNQSLRACLIITARLDRPLAKAVRM